MDDLELCDNFMESEASILEGDIPTGGSAQSNLPMEDSSIPIDEDATMIEPPTSNKSIFPGNHQFGFHPHFPDGILSGEGAPFVSSAQLAH